MKSTILALVLCFVSLTAFAQANPNYPPVPGGALEDSGHVIAATVQMGYITATGPNGPTTPVLSAYVLRFDFDAANGTRVVSVNGGDGMFATVDSYTDLATANASGILKVIAHQSNPLTPTGTPVVCRIRFTNPNLYPVKVSAESLMTAAQGNFGPSPMNISQYSYLTPAP